MENDDTPKSALNQLKTLVRIGSPTPDKERSLDDTIAEMLQTLFWQRKSYPDSWTERDLLRLASLSAEFHHTYGRNLEGLDLLEELAQPLLDQLDHWHKARTDLRNAKTAPTEAELSSLKFQIEADQRLLRQKIWAMLALLFYKFYIQGRSKDALSKLYKILDLIEAELVSSDRLPFGTLARTHYFIAHCKRSIRNFNEAEQHFIQSLKFASKRLNRELRISNLPSQSSHHASDLEWAEEHRFSVICSARVLGLGLSWALLQQGQIRKALPLLYSSSALLAPTGHKSSKDTVAYLRSVAELRVNKPESQEWQEALKILLDLVENSMPSKDRRGRRRALSAIAFAYLDLAVAVESAKEYALRDAKTYIDKLGKLGEGSERPFPEYFKQNLLLARWCLLKSTPDTDGARKALQLAQRYAADADSYGISVADQGDDTVSLAIVEGLIYKAKGDFKEALKCFSGLLDTITNDPVLEAETRLCLANTYLKLDRIDDTRKELSWWTKNASVIDNAYLHQTASEIELELRRQQPKLHIEIPTESNVEDAEILVRYAMIKHYLDMNETITSIAKILKVNRSTLYVWIKAYEDYMASINDKSPK